MRKFRPLPLSIILISVLLLSGCHGDPYWDDYTRSQPQIQDMVGTYVLTEMDEQPVKDLKAKGGKSVSVSQVTLHADGTFSALNIPRWGTGDLHPRPILYFQSGSGTWRFRNGPAASNDNTIFWSVTFASTDVDLSTGYPNLIGEKAPYTLIFNYATDPDFAEAMIFKKKD
jgi:hypothetical protein